MTRVDAEYTNGHYKLLQEKGIFNTDVAYDALMAE